MSNPPNRVVDAIYRAVEDAIASGVSVADFRSTCMEAWDVCLAEKRNFDNYTWREK